MYQFISRGLEPNYQNLTTYVHFKSSKLRIREYVRGIEHAGLQLEVASTESIQNEQSIALSSNNYYSNW